MKTAREMETAIEQMGPFAAVDPSAYAAASTEITPELAKAMRNAVRQYTPEELAEMGVDESWSVIRPTRPRGFFAFVYRALLAVFKGRN